MNNLVRITTFGIKTRTFRLMTSKYTLNYSTKKEEQHNEIIHSGGFKRDHDDKETKKSFFDCENEKWFPEQLNSGENYQDKIVDDRGDGSKLFPYRYGNSFWDPHNYN
jgi:hypothetical protein